MTSKPLTEAQLAQQKNRNPDGTYREKHTTGAATGIDLEPDQPDTLALAGAQAIEQWYKEIPPEQRGTKAAHQRFEEIEAEIYLQHAAALDAPPEPLEHDSARICATNTTSIIIPRHGAPVINGHGTDSLRYRQLREQGHNRLEAALATLHGTDAWDTRAIDDYEALADRLGYRLEGPARHAIALDRAWHETTGHPSTRNNRIHMELALARGATPEQAATRARTTARQNLDIAHHDIEHLLEHDWNEEGLKGKAPNVIVESGAIHIEHPRANGKTTYTVWKPGTGTWVRDDNIRAPFPADPTEEKVVQILSIRHRTRMRALVEMWHDAERPHYLAGRPQYPDAQPHA